MTTHFYYPSASGGTIHGCRWEPEGKPKAIVQILHGVSEHVGRYENFARFLNAQGILVVAQDHQGHGGSVAKGENMGAIQGSWFKLIQDSYRLLCNTKLDHPGLPYFLLGFSMGSHMARTMAAKFKDMGLTGLILCGTGWLHPGLINTASVAASIEGKRIGNDVPSAFLQNMAFGSANYRVEHKRTAYDWLSRDPYMVDAYLNDPLCNFSVTPGLFKETLVGFRYNQDPAHIQRMPKDLPILLASGGEDVSGGCGKGVQQTAQAFTKAGVENVTVKLFPLCRHDILHEINREEVWQYLLTWIKKQVPHA